MAGAMRTPTSAPAPIAIFAVLLLGGLPASTHAQSRPLDAVEADRLRIRDHLERVEAELLAADVSHLTAEQRAARARNVERLRAYRERGEFPHGYAGQPGARVPTFIDADGRACAMGWLVIDSGYADVAEAIARDQNHARVPEIVHPALEGWLAANGMTLAEATRVQPSYCFDCGDAGMQAVCGSDGAVYSNACLAECEGAFVVGAATCDGETCTCSDAGSPAEEDAGHVGADAGHVEHDASVPPADAGAMRDAAPITPALDAGGGGAVATSSGCTVARSSTAGCGWALPLGVALAMAISLRARRRRSAPSAD